jgi:hypothetical protein
MKKSFLYVVPAALILALLFAGCPQDSDDDGDSGGGKVTAPGSDLSYIAFAFGEGVNTVKAVNHIDLGSQELVIPKGKTLDLETDNVYIREITDGSKIIIQGTIRFAKEQSGGGGLNFTAAPDSAKIIADKDFIRSNVWVDYGNLDDWEAAEIQEADRPTAEKKNAVIWARWQQIVIIDTYEKFKEYGSEDDKKGYLYGGTNGKYVAIEAPSDGIAGGDATLINEKAKGLRLYLVGEPVVFNSPRVFINLAGSPNGGVYKAWAPKTPETNGNILFAYSGGDGSLTVAGNADVQSGYINAPGGFTVWGVVKNTGDAKDTSDTMPITAGGTEFRAWTARLKGAAFSGKVYLLGSIANTFGASATFDSDSEISGPSTFNSATFNGTATFTGPVRFVKQSGSSEDKQVIFKKFFSFAEDVFLHDSVEFTVKGEAKGGIFGYPPNLINTWFNLGEDAVVGIDKPKIDDIAKFDYNVTFSNDVEIGTAAVFQKDTTFEGDVKFTQDVTFGSNSVYGSASTTTIKGLATFVSGKKISFGTESFAKGGSQSKVYIEEAVFNGNNTITGISELSFGNTESPAIQFKAGVFPGGTEAGHLTIPANGGMEFKDNTLTFTGEGGTLSSSLVINNAKVKIEQKASITLSKLIPFELVKAADGADDAGFEIIGSAELDNGAITGKGGTVKASGGLLLNIPPRMVPFEGGDPEKDLAPPAVSVDGVLIDLSEGGGIVFCGSESRVVFKNGGNMRLNDGPTGLAIASPINTNATIIAGWRAGSVALLTGSEGINGAVGTLGSDYPEYRGGTAALVNDTGEPIIYSNLLTNANGFVFVKSPSATAGSRAVDTTPYDVTYPGSIAVFSREY